MVEAVLCVDDEPSLLEFCRRVLRDYAVETAASGEAALPLLAERGPFAVVVSDLRMPGMDGIEFLARVRESYPASVRVLLTGHADVSEAVEVVNRGGVFRFLTKPCSPADLRAAVSAAAAQYRLAAAERELLDQTLRGSVQVLAEVFALAAPAEFGRAVRVQRLARNLGGYVDGAGGWEVEVAAVLSQLGSIVVPDSMLRAARRGARLDPDDQRQVDRIPGVAGSLLRHIPRLEPVTRIIDHIGRPFAAEGRSPPHGKDLPLGARVLTVAFDFDALLESGVPKPQAVGLLRERTGRYDPDVLTALDAVLRPEIEPTEREVLVADLTDGMVVAEDLYNDAGVLLLGRGQPITDAGRRRLDAMTAAGQSPRRVRVLVPPPDAPAAS